MYINNLDIIGRESSLTPRSRINSEILKISPLYKIKVITVKLGRIKNKEKIKKK